MKKGEVPRPVFDQFGRSGQSGKGQRDIPGADRRELTELEERTLYHFQKLQESLEWKDGQQPNPFEVYQALASIALEVQPATFLGEVKTPDLEAFHENMQGVRSAFALVSFPYMNEIDQLTIRSMYRHHEGEELTISPRQKQMLTMITTKAGIPDDPQRLTYPYSMISGSRRSIPGNGQKTQR